MSVAPFVRLLAIMGDYHPTAALGTAGFIGMTLSRSILDETLRAYQQFAPLYAVLVGSLGITESESQVILDLLARYGIVANARILDLGCGPGTVAHTVTTRGHFSQLFALDACPEMIEQARMRLPTDRVIHATWDNLAKCVGSCGPFAFVYSLSQSITHALAADVPNILESVFQILAPGGMFCMDVRPWIHTPTGDRVEPDRPPGIWRLGARINVRGADFWLDDTCTYRDQRQFVSYRLLNARRGCSGSLQHDVFAVSYNTMTADEYCSLMTDAGFQGVECSMSADWPYLLVTGTR